MAVAQADGSARIVGRYALHAPLASGGMATVHLGRLLGPEGFSRTVAIKRLHAQYAKDPEFVTMFLDEARLAARIRHANVIPTLDVVTEGDEVFLVMEYAPGESLARLARTVFERHERMPLRIVSAIMAGVLHGLHAAHEARDEHGVPLGIVHRDVSPQNVVVGVDGVAKLLDFGVAKAEGRAQFTREGQLKGKLGYMPPEQLNGAAVTRAADLYAAGVILWELVTGERLFWGDNEGVIVVKILTSEIPSPIAVLRQRGALAGGPEEAHLPYLEALVLCALRAAPGERFATAKEMAQELERAVPPAHAAEVAAWLEAHAHEALSRRALTVEAIERAPSSRAGSFARYPEDPLTELTPGSLPRVSGTDPRFEQGAQPSSLSVVTRGPSSAAQSPERGNPVVAAVSGALVGVLLIALVFAWRAIRSDGAASAPLPPAAAEVAEAPTLSPPATPALPPTAPPTPAASASAALPAPDAPKAAAVTPTTPTASVVSPPPRPVAPPPPKGPVAPPPPKVDCTPPYTTDADGIRHYKPACL